MKAKKVVIWLFGILTIVAVISGLVFFFVGNKKISSKPESLQITPLGDDFMLWTTYNPEYSYIFRVEKMNNDGTFVIIETEKSSVNNVKLSDFSNSNFVPTQTYRFSACYCLNNNSGQFCDPLVWVAV